MNRVAIDTGPLVASLNRRDHHHAWVLTALSRLEPPLLTCEAVLAETCFLLRSDPGVAPSILEMVHRGLLRVDFQLSSEASSIAKLMKKYANVPMSLADACLVRMTELETGTVLLTLDSDFRVYRKNGRQVIPTIMPEV